MILIVDDEVNGRENIATYLRSKNYEVQGASTLKEARDLLAQGIGDLVLLDVQLPDGYGPDLLYEIGTSPQRPPVILFTAHGDIDMAVEAMRNGAQDFLTKPIEFSRLEQSIHRSCEIISLRRELDHFRMDQNNRYNFVIGGNPKVKDLINAAEKAAATSVSVMITGETGTGKEILAKFIHNSGPRANKPFIAVNCAAIQPTMLESELFGYEKGAFTSAEKRKYGLMEVADGGILFLDEIASTPLDIQAKLLRALEERSFRRVGGTAVIKVDVQVIAASNRNLPYMIEQSQFREDLYYRLKVVDLHLPPLRDRKQDIPELVGFFVRQINPRLGLNIQDVSQRALQAMVTYEWPGNIRELSNAIERAMLFCDEAVIDIGHLPSDVAKQSDN